MTVVPDAWDEMCLVEVMPQGGTAIACASLTSDITAMDWGEKQIEVIPTLSGGDVVRRVPMTEESITLKLYPIGVGGTAETTATGIMALFHPPSDNTQPKVQANTRDRTKYRLVLLWATTLPATASTIPIAGVYAYRIQIFNAYMVSAKPSFDDKTMSVECSFKWAPFQKDGTRNKIEESTDDSAQLAAVTAFA